MIHPADMAEARDIWWREHPDKLSPWDAFECGWRAAMAAVRVFHALTLKEINEWDRMP